MKRRPGKDPLLDNAKVVLIVSVVCGHAWTPLIDEIHAVRALYMTVYAFHMPAFVVLSGFLSKSYTGRPDQRYRLVTTLIVPYAIFTVLYSGMRMWTERELDPSVMSPFFQLWFLVALLVWRLTAPIWKLVRFPLAIALIISLGCSTMELPRLLDAGRILQFLPFFVAGLVLKREHIDRLRRPLARAVLTLGGAGIVAAAFVFAEQIDRHWLYLYLGSGQLGLSLGEGLAIRVALLVCAVVLIGAFLAWVPGRARWYTALGAATMYPFLLHGFFIKIAQDGLGLYDKDFTNSVLGAVTVTACAVALTALLFSRPARWLTRPIVEPSLGWVLKRPAPAG